MNFTGKTTTQELGQASLTVFSKGNRVCTLSIGRNGSAVRMYRIVLACKGVPAGAGTAGAHDITEEFTHRPWHENVSCVWDGSQLILQADNDFDSNRLALLDEFSDAISACIKDGFDGDIEVLSVTAL
jgi:hypothetical protein